MNKTYVAIAAVLAAVALACIAGTKAAGVRETHATRDTPRAEVAANGPTHAPRPTPSTVVPEVALPGDHTVGEGKAIENLTVFPVLAKHQEDVGPFTTLGDALDKKTAEVRETGDGGESGDVNQLVIENRGKLPIFVLAGTVVKGGRQDRQIGQDFIVGAGQTVAVDAFCVEHGRWTPERDGVATQGKFGTLETLANSEVRAAGQYQQDQGRVWAKVEEVNDANKKSAASGTLAASLDDREILAKRAALANAVTAFFDAVSPEKDVVGVAYAVDGRVRGVRWFASHQLFSLYRATLVNTAAVEAITAQGAAAARGERPETTAVARDAVALFVAGVEQAKVTRARETAGENVNEYKETRDAYGSTTTYKSAPPAATAAPAKPVDISSDFTAK